VPKPLLLLPPSEGKAAGGSGPPWPAGPQRFPVLEQARRAVLDALGDPDVTAGRTRPAIERYTGVLYGALDYGSLPPDQRRRIDAQVVIVSGLWGLVAPRDRIPAYRLKMSASLPTLGKLSTWWRPTLSPLLDDLAGRRTVWNLLPIEHDAAWRSTRRTGRTVRVRFLDDVERNGRRELVVVNHWNKLLKGALVRHVVEHQLEDPDGLVGFDHPQGYRYDAGRTERDGDVLTVTMIATR
jgi:cytoplasmic iron level regulating protein YaaA (DUF328/UPF0246 family)